MWPSPFLSVIVSCSGDPSALRRSLDSLVRSDFPDDRWELIVVGGGEDGAAAAAPFAHTLVRVPAHARGLPYWRNRGADVARGQVLVFCDAGSCVARDALQEITNAFERAPETGGIIASTQMPPAHAGVIACYRAALRKGFEGPGEPRGAAAGRRPAAFAEAPCSAFRAAVFFEAGAYDEWCDPAPVVAEDDLVARVVALGRRVIVAPEVRGTAWGELSLRRCVRDLLRTTRAASPRQGGRLASGVLAWTSILLAGAALVAGPVWWSGAGICLLANFISNASVYRSLLRSGGWILLVVSVPLHMALQLLEVAAAGAVWIERHVMGEPRPTPVVEAFNEVGVDTWPPVPRPLVPSSRSGVPARPPMERA